MLHVNVDLYHTTNRTATTNGPISLAHAAGLGKYGYGNGFVVMERISGTVLNSGTLIWTEQFLSRFQNILYPLFYTRNLLIDDCNI